MCPSDTSTKTTSNTSRYTTNQRTVRRTVRQISAPVLTPRNVSQILAASCCCCCCRQYVSNSLPMTLCMLARVLVQFNAYTSCLSGLSRECRGYNEIQLSLLDQHSIQVSHGQTWYVLTLLISSRMDAVRIRHAYTLQNASSIIQTSVSAHATIGRTYTFPKIYVLDLGISSANLKSSFFSSSLVLFVSLMWSCLTM